MSFTVFKNYNKFAIVHNIPSKIKRIAFNISAKPSVNLPDNIEDNNLFSVWGMYNPIECNIQYNFAVDVIFSYIKPDGKSAQALRTFNIFAYSVETAIFKATNFFHEHLKNLEEDFDVNTAHLINVNDVFIRLADFSTDSYDLPYKITHWYEWECNSDNLSVPVKETPKYLLKYNCKIAYVAKNLVTLENQNVIASSIQDGILEAKKRILHKVYINTEYKEKVEFKGINAIYIAIDKNEYVGKVKTVFNM